MSELLKPPAVPETILNFFASQPDFPALAGDISEEFHQRIQSRGVKAAKRWYWSEALRNAFALTWREVMRTPVRTFVLALGCLIAVSAVTGLYALIRWNSFQGSVEEILVSRYYVPLGLNLVPPLAMGWIGGRLLPGREWALALLFTFISASFALAGALYLVVVLKANIPAPLWQTVIFAANVLRQGCFWLGCLWIRHSRLRSLDRRIEAPDRE
jgi:hypothetical protein